MIILKGVLIHFHLYIYLNKLCCIQTTWSLYKRNWVQYALYSHNLNVFSSNCLSRLFIEIETLDVYIIKCQTVRF
jgi:hypothetical protein